MNTLGVQVDGRIGRSHVKADRIQSTSAHECLGENMLAGVLLHVVKAAYPVNRAFQDVAINQFGDTVNDLSLFAFINLSNRTLLNQSQIMRLPS